MRDEKLVDAFVKSYSAHVAHEDADTVRDFVTQLNDGVDHNKLYEEFGSYTSMIDALYVFEDGIRFGRANERT